MGCATPESGPRLFSGVFGNIHDINWDAISSYVIYVNKKAIKSFLARFFFLSLRIVDLQSTLRSLSYILQYRKIPRTTWNPGENSGQEISQVEMF